jgi:hypothetical protein
MKTINGIVRINLKQSKIAYIVTGITFLLGAANMIVMVAISIPDNSTNALGNYLFLLPILMAIFIPAKNFSKLMNLGIKRKEFFKACIPAYVIISASVALLDLLMRLLLDPIIARHIGLLNLSDVFRFMPNGAVVAFFQMSAFLFLLMCFLHTLTLAQGHWYGWVADALIISIISVFTPVAPLRASLVWFFKMIIFNNSALVQIASCLVVSAAVYAASLVPIRSKQV